MKDVCLEENEIVDLVTGNLDVEASREAEAHIDRCTACRLVLIELARVFELRASSLPKVPHEVTEDEAEELPILLQPAAMMRGTTIGRYVVLDVLGAGAMGVVYAAFDPELDRKVALKLIRQRAVDKTSSARLVREARSTAKLSHPNVVVVHDVGEHDGAVFMAMEHVEGGTLGEWLAHEDRDPEMILSAFHEAGLGLQAAHEGGLVHRDFKPANVLMGLDGRPRVTDFGLARAGETEGDVDVLATQPGLGTSSLDDATFTRTGALVGTPAYMSSEQFAGQLADARSDQFSFCVALFEALCGVRPFAGKTVTELAANVSAGRIGETKRLDALPRRVRSALRRGLQAEPGDRFADMASLLRALGPSGLAATSWGTRALFLVGLTLGGTGLALAVSAAGGHEDSSCVDAATVMRDVWDSNRADALQASMAVGAGKHGATTAAKLRADLDAFSDAWVETHDAACASQLPSGAVAKSVALRCLDQRFVYFGALVDALELHDADALEHAAGAVSNIGDPARCNDTDWRAGKPVPEPPRELAPTVEALREQLARVQVDEQLGYFDEAAAAAKPLLEEALAAGFDPLTAEVHHEIGLVHAERSEYEDALRSFEQAFHFGLRGNHDTLMVAAGAVSLQIVGQSAPDPQRARLWRSLTAAVVDRVGAYTPSAAQYWNAVGLSARLEGKYDEAREAFERSIEIHRSVGANERNVMFPLNNLAALEMDQQRFAAAESRARELLELQEHTFGPDHPDMVAALSTLASALASQNEIDEAANTIGKALAIGEVWFGANSPRMDTVRMNLAMIRKRQGDLEGARDLYGGVLERWIEQRGAEDPYVGLAHNNLASTLFALDQLDDALRHHERALAIWTAAHGADHAKVGQGHSSVASDLLALGRCDEARAHLEAGLDIAKTLDPSSIILAANEANQAKYELQCTDDVAVALRWAEAAVEHGKLALGPTHPLVGRFAATAAEAAVRTEDFERARQHLEVGLELVDATKFPASRARLMYVAARLAQHEGEVEGVPKHRAAGLELVPEHARWDALRARLDAL